jgi:hypothetical protein
VKHVQRSLLVRGEGEVTLDHHALGDGWIAGETELCGDGSLVHLAVSRERRLLAVDGNRPARDGPVLQRPPHQARRGDRPAVVAEPCCAGIRELGHLGQLAAGLPLRDRGQEADRYLRLSARRLHERAEHRGRVDDRVGVGHGEDRAEAAGRRRLRAARERLLVLAAGSPQVHVRVDEGGREHEPGRVEHAVPVRRQARTELGDDARVDLDVDLRVDPFRRVEHACTPDEQILLGAILDEEHHATSTGRAASTGTGPVVSRS